MNTAAAPSALVDHAVDELISEQRARQSSRLSPRSRFAGVLLGGAFLAAAAATVLALPSERGFSGWMLLLLVAAYVVASRIEFEVGTGAAVPTQLVLVPMLFLLPVAVVPLCVAAGLVTDGLVACARARVHPERAAVRLVSSWHALGPAVVLGLAGATSPAWSDWPVYLAALASQFALDYAASSAFEWIALGVSPRERVRFTLWVNLVDVALAPVGLAIAFVADSNPPAFLLGMPLVGLLAIFARERRARIDHALELGHAYRGTALLLGDVVEADDAYTGSHSRDVVTLVLAVAEELGLDQRQQRDAEFVALLHDVGKVRIPTELIRKPGPLTPEERALMQTHTIEGQEMLEKVGGLLGEVGRIVRSCHERYDGGGYPDGVAGEEIPLIARIVAACDAFSAMTTDRSYRAALPLAVAVDELRANAGTQFDPEVVEALIAAVENVR